MMIHNIRDNASRHRQAHAFSAKYVPLGCGFTASESGTTRTPSRSSTARTGGTSSTRALAMSQPPYTGWVVHCFLSKPHPFEPVDSHRPDPSPRRTTEPPLRRAGAIPVASAAASPIDAGSSIRNSIKLVARYVLLSPVTNASWEARSEIFEEVGDASESESATSPESVLVPGCPSRSRASVFYSEISRGIHGRRSAWGSWRKMSMLSLGQYAAISLLLLDQHCFSRQKSSQEANPY